MKRSIFYSLFAAICLAALSGCATSHSATPSSVQPTHTPAPFATNELLFPTPIYTSGAARPAKFATVGTPVFRSTNILSQNSDGKTWTVVFPLSFHSDVLASTITVPAGFQTDLASVPRFLWAVYPPFGKYTEAAIVHDYLYTWQPCTRAQADSVLMEGMQTLGVSWLSRQIIYDNVRAFGGCYWNRVNSADKILKPIL